MITFFNLDKIENNRLKYAVIAAKHDGKWIYCRHKERTTWEIPGGTRERLANFGMEDIFITAKRELCEETGAVDFDLKPLCIYGVSRGEATTYGLLCFAEVKVLGDLPHDTEIAEIKLFDTIPHELTYPEIQPYLFEKVLGFER